MRRVPWPPAWEAAIVLSLTVLAAALRFSRYGSAPLFTDNLDEIQFSWAGLNLLAHGDAYTWSFFPVYPKPVDVVAAYGVNLPVVHHWMDHPPGFSLLMGAWLWVSGPHDMFSLTPERVRVLPVLFAASTIPLGYIAVRRALGGWAALFGSVLLATAPMLLGVTLLADSLVHCRQEHFPRWQVGLLLLDAFLAPTFKITGLAVGGVAVAILLTRDRRRVAAATLVATVAGGLVYPIYGWLVDWPLFTAVVHQQSLNRIGMMAAYELIASPAGINRPLHDGWWLLGWIALGWLALTGRRSRAELLLAWPAFAYALVIMLLAGQQLTSQYGWYRLILMPQVMLAAGAFAWRAVAAPSLARLAPVLALGGATATNWWFEGAIDPVLETVLLALVLVPAAITAAPRFAAQRPVAQGLAAATLAVLTVGNLAESLELPEILGHM